MNVVDNALFLLRIMLENGFVLNQGVTTRQLKELSGLDEIAYTQVEMYLFNKKLIDGSGGEDDGTRGATSMGVDYVSQEMQSRIQLSLNAERVLGYIVKVEPPRYNFEEVDAVEIDQIGSELNLQRDEVVDALQELEDEGLIESPFDGTTATMWGAFSTAEGRNALRRNFRLPQLPSTQIGAVYNAPVTANNLVNAINSQIEQTFNQNEPDAIRQTIDATLNSLADQISTELELNQRIAYLQTIAELKAELAKTEPNPSAIQRLVSMISCADAANGSLDLAIKVAPYIPIVYEGIKNLLRAMGAAI